MSLTRRQALILGGAGVVGAGIVTVPISGVSAKSASKLSDSNMPRPYGTPLTIPRRWPTRQPSTPTASPPATTP
ncbi:hypothetical protein PJ267_08185 [Arthrobacter sp. OVS8]|nr:hypothetical protein PJ267_08185 [Arthrobacter sp. OVS8]